MTNSSRPLLKQPNEWSCIPTSLAQLVGLSVERVIQEYGHDGSELVEGNPYGRRCFTEVETILAAYRLGVHLVPLLRYLEIHETRRETLIDALTFKRMLERHSGIILLNGRSHATGHSLCWLNRHSLAIDPSEPREEVYGRSYECQNVEGFLAWVNQPPT
jgi:hypothetical protein